MSDPKVYAEIGDGLVVRAATADDADALAEFNNKVHIDVASGTEAWWIAEWSRDLLTKPHPTFKHDDMIVVEDTVKSVIASTTTYLTQQMSYGGVTFNVGRPELVGTAAEYRNRGLIRRQFELMHNWAKERQDDVLLILGIPSYYRQFGYEMAISESGGRTSNMMAMPRWGEGEERGYRMRKPEPEDVPLMTRLLSDSASRSLVSPVFKEDEVRYMTFDRNERSAVAHRTGILCEADGDGYGTPIGVIMYALILAIDEAVILRIEMEEPKYWRLAMPALLKEFEETARLAKEEHPDPEREIKTIRSDMQPDHPAFVFDDGALGRPADRQYAWYVRLTDPARFIRRIKAVLESRIADSIHAGISGKREIAIGSDGVSIEFLDGKITSVSKSDTVNWETASAWFPDLTFLHMLFGRKSLEELMQSFPDCRAGSNADAHLFETMFPKATSDLSLTLT